MPTPVTSKVYTVSELARQIRQTLEDEVGRVWVEGEISNYKLYGSGHSYFVIKDAAAQLSAVLFAGARAALPATLRLEDGQRVRAYCEVTAYEATGKMQLRVMRIESTGLGDLMRRFEALKQKLQAEGLFEASRKRPLPRLPRRIGIVTSATGAVIHDMLNILGRRFPNVQVRLAPVKVQGAGAAEEIAAAVALFNRACGPGSAWPADVLIVGRGGGSLEDLWAFNEEAVVRAVAGSAVPVVSAVGHEVDFTLCDFAADLRAPTPSAAAELVIAPKTEFEAEVSRVSRGLRQALLQRAAEMKGRLGAARASAALRQPQRLVERLAQRIDTLHLRLERALARALGEARARAGRADSRLALVRERAVRVAEARLAAGAGRLERAGRLLVERKRARVAAADRQLTLLSPLAVLERGYSLTHAADGRLVRSVSEVPAGMALVTRVRDGEIRSVAVAGQPEV